MTTDQTAALAGLLRALESGDDVARRQLADLLTDLDRPEEAALLRAGGAVILWPPRNRGVPQHIVPMEPGDYRGTDFGYALQHLQDRHEYACVNCEEDGFDQQRGQWYSSDDFALCIIHGTFGNDNSPGASHYTYATVYETREEYLAALAEWDSCPEYLETEEDEEDEE